MSDSLAFLLITLALSALLAFGLITGDMPSKGTTYSKQESPILYWTAGSLLSALTVFAYALAVYAAFKKP